MVMLKVLHSIKDLERLYVPRNEGGRGPARIEDNFNTTQGLCKKV